MKPLGTAARLAGRPFESRAPRATAAGRDCV